MSFQIASGVTAPLTVTNLFGGGAATPISLCIQTKVNGFNSSSFVTANQLTAVGTLQNHDSWLYGNDGISEGFAAQTSGGTAARPGVLAGNMIGEWYGSVATFTSNSRRDMYMLDELGVLKTTESTGFSDAGTLSDLIITQQSWAWGSRLFDKIAIYGVALTSTQAEEYLTTGEVAALTPIAAWDFSVDWGVGTVADTSGNGNTITPPAGWTYDADVPSSAATVTTTGPYKPADTITYSTTGLGTITSATLTDSAANVLTLTSVTDTTAIIPAFTTSGQQANLFGTVTLTVGDGTDTATTTFALDPPAGYTAVTASGLTVPSTDPLDWNYPPTGGWTNEPADTDQLFHNDAFITYNANGTTTYTPGDLGTSYTATYYLIDATDGLLTKVTKNYLSGVPGGVTPATKYRRFPWQQWVKLI